MKIRPASEHDTAGIVRMMREMVEAFEALGHHAMSRAPETWAAVDARVSESLRASDHLFLIVEDEAAAVVIGMLEARVDQPALVFAPKKILHVSAVFVAPEHRRRGIARSLLLQALEWGRAQGCVEAQLNALLGNPSRRLFTALGFQDVEVRMGRPLGPT